LAIIGTFMNSYTADKYDGLMQKKLMPGRHYFRIGRDVRTFIIFLGAFVNQPLIVLILIALMTNAENVRRVFILHKNG
jgi:CDP-L-myo-inositol myo-inositolphosphotransferase